MWWAAAPLVSIWGVRAQELLRSRQMELTASKVQSRRLSQQLRGRRKIYKKQLPGQSRHHQRKKSRRALLTVRAAVRRSQNLCALAAPTDGTAVESVRYAKILYLLYYLRIYSITFSGWGLGRTCGWVFGLEELLEFWALTSPGCWDTHSIVNWYVCHTLIVKQLYQNTFLRIKMALENNLRDLIYKGCNTFRFCILNWLVKDFRILHNPYVFRSLIK